MIGWRDGWIWEDAEAEDEVIVEDMDLEGCIQ
jgi:hypothetical protein